MQPKDQVGTRQLISVNVNRETANVAMVVKRSLKAECARTVARFLRCRKLARGTCRIRSCLGMFVMVVSWSSPPWWCQIVFFQDEEILEIRGCEGGGDVVGVVTPLVGGVAQAFHDDRVVELSVQLGV